jgi:hypothetical protein
MALVPYTSTYVDVADSIIDATNLISEFERVAEYLNGWIESYESIGTQTVTYIDRVEIENPEIAPLGFIQQIVVDADLTRVDFTFTERAEGNPHRVYNVIRFESKDTQFTVNGAAGETHVFSVNESPYFPSLTQADGYYCAVVIVNYSQNQGMFIQVFGNNSEASSVSGDDVLTTKAL